MHNTLSGGIPGWAWAVFALMVAFLLAADLWIFRKGAGATRKRQLISVVAWVTAGLGFGIFIWGIGSGRLAQEYFGAYAMEEGLSLDNMFLFFVIFHALKVPERYEHKVLMWGVLGAVVFRGIFIFLGVSAISEWQWITYVFAAALLYAAWRAWRKDPATQEESSVLHWLSRHLPVDESAQSGEFIVCRGGRRVATPLLLALIAIELTDIMFAIDSVPAALSITHNRFIIYTSNILAVLGLRSLYLYLSGAITCLPFLHYGLAAVLGFASIKIALDRWVQIPPLLSIAVVIVLIGGSIWASVHTKSRQAAPAP